MSILTQISTRQPRRGELDRPLLPQRRRALTEMHAELADLHRRAQLINDDFLALLISSAADEARDQLRDDLILREGEATAANGRDDEAIEE